MSPDKEMKIERLLERYNITEHDLVIGWTNFKFKYANKFKEFPFISKTTYQNLRSKANLARKWINRDKFVPKLINEDYDIVFSIDNYELNNFFSVVRLIVKKKKGRSFRIDYTKIFEILKPISDNYDHHSETFEDFNQLVKFAIRELNIENLNRILVFSNRSEAFVQWCKEMESMINCEISSNPQHPFKLKQIHPMLRRRFGSFLNDMDSREKIKNYLKKNNLDKNYIILEIKVDQKDSKNKISSDNILEILSDNWYTLNELIFRLKIKEDFDVKFLKLKLEELEQEKKIINIDMIWKKSSLQEKATIKGEENLIPHYSYSPTVLIIFEDSKVILNDRFYYFFPEISILLKIFDGDQKREFYNCEEYQWRRKFNLLNLNSVEKKSIYFSKIKQNNKKTEGDRSNIDMVLDLNKNLLFINSKDENMRFLGDIKFKQYLVRPITEFFIIKAD